MPHHLLLPHARQSRERPADRGVHTLTDQAGVAALRSELLLAAQRECRWLATSADALPPADTTLIGVRRRGICTRELVEQATAAGDEYRVLPEVRADLLIADDVALVCAAEAVLVRSPVLVPMLVEHFELLWDRALPLDGGGGLTDVQRRILRLAAVGLKDEAIARNLGLSSRSVRRHMEKLAARSGASNRLTLGIAAARLGWV